jgi:hypothetical protein
LRASVPSALEVALAASAIIPTRTGPGPVHDRSLRRTGPRRVCDALLDATLPAVAESGCGVAVAASAPSADAWEHDDDGALAAARFVELEERTQRLFANLNAELVLRIAEVASGAGQPRRCVCKWLLGCPPCRGVAHELQPCRLGLHRSDRAFALGLMRACAPEQAVAPHEDDELAAATCCCC